MALPFLKRFCNATEIVRLIIIPKYTSILGNQISEYSYYWKKGYLQSDDRNQAISEDIPQPHRIGHKSIGQGRRGVGIKIMSEFLVEGQTLGNRNTEAILTGNTVIRNGPKQRLIIDSAAEFQGASMHLQIQISAGTPIQLQNARLTRIKRHCKLGFVHSHGSPMQPYQRIRVNAESRTQPMQHTPINSDQGISLNLMENLHSRKSVHTVLVP